MGVLEKLKKACREAMLPPAHVFMRTPIACNRENIGIMMG